VLKEHQMFLVSDVNGDIAAHNVDGQGLYWRDTRFLSYYELSIEGGRPQLLSATGEHSFMTNLQFANVAFSTADGQDVPARSISIRRNRFLSGGLQERIGLFNYNRFSVSLRLVLSFGSDFRDMFDVRGYAKRSKHGDIDLPRREGRSVELRYAGLDGVSRSTLVRFDQDPFEVEIHPPDPLPEEPLRHLPGISGRGDPRAEVSIRPPTASAHFLLDVPPGRFAAITFQVVPHLGTDAAEVAPPSLDAEFLVIRASYEDWETGATRISTDHEIFNAILRRSLHDLRLLSDRLPNGYLPSAGIPWFAVPFGRDSLITSLQSLSLQPQIARATLQFLADHQGTQVSEWRDEEPGKILHEIRMGELAALGQVPHAPYYGSVDSTPLFLVTLGEYLRWTADWELGRMLRPHAEAALTWIDAYGDLDGDGYVEYISRSQHGIRNQGWKDSIDALCYRDGRNIEPPIALAEVQGYVFDAWMQMAEYFRKLGDDTRATRLHQRALELRERFQREWWIEEEGCFALALDRDKRPVRAVSSNPGHCLWSGLFDDEMAHRLGKRLMADDMQSGWGIRTLSSKEPMFNPMSYHNGSVWPHDNSLIVAGLKRYGMDDRAMRVADEVIDAAVRFPLYRLPELYCGFARDRRYFSMPAQYPVSCSPQAWAAGSIFLMVQAMLGLRPDADGNRLNLRPTLLGRINEITIENLRVGSHRVDLEIRQDGAVPRVTVLRGGPIEVVIDARAPATAPA
jgi:glycogen debranching enzyme